MPSKPVIHYKKIEKEVGAIIARGAADLKAAYRKQVLLTNWEVGFYLQKELPLSEVPSAANARAIRRLAKKFGRPDGYFYGLIKFARIYPEFPRDSTLSWSHYDVLIKIEDDAARAQYERAALRENIPAKVLYGMIVKDRRQVKAQRRLALIGGPEAGKIPFKRGRLYHYKVLAPKDAASNTGTATLDLGFRVSRDIPLSRKSGMHVGHMVRTLRTDPSGELFNARIAKADKDRLYTYKARVDRVPDGDTLVVTVDLGLKNKVNKERLRLRGIDCPEMSTKRGVCARDYVRKRLAKVAFIVIKTYWDDKYGRMLADVFYLPGEADAEAVAAKGIYLNQELVDKGLAEVWDSSS